MKTFALLCAGILLTTTIGLSQEQKDKKPGGPPDMAELMKAYMAVATPGEHHKNLDHFVGTWDVAVKTFWGGPGAPPAESKGSVTTKWILDGRFILEDVNGEMLLPDEKGQMKPRAFKGMGMTGYDNYRNMYVSSWADNMGTALFTSTGSYNPNDKVYNFYGQMDEPGLKVVGRSVRSLIKVVSKDKHVFEMYDLHAGPDYKVMEITYTRKQ